MITVRRCVISATIVASLALPSCRRQAEPARRVVRTTAAAAKPQDLRNADIEHTIPLEPLFLESSAIDSAEEAGGVVRGERRDFTAGHPIYLMMRFRESPEALEATVRLLDPSKKIVYGDMHAMNGAKAVTFAIPGTVVRPGKYTVQGYWGGNLACEYKIEVKRPS